MNGWTDIQKGTGSRVESTVSIGERLDRNTAEDLEQGRVYSPYSLGD